MTIQTDRKDFVFPSPLLPFGTIWEASAQTKELQIATTQADAEICNTFVFGLHLKNKENNV